MNYNIRQHLVHRSVELLTKAVHLPVQSGGNDDKNIHDAWMIEEWIEFSESHRVCFAANKCPHSFSASIGAKFGYIFLMMKVQIEKYWL